MLKINSRFLATSISVAALTVGMAVVQFAQKAAAQTAAGAFASTPLFVGFGLTNFQGIGSDAGAVVFRQGSVDIGATGVPIEFTSAGTLQPGELQVAIANTKLVLPYNNGVGSLSQENVRRIFRGEVTNWNEVGGPDQPITVVFRSDNSGLKFVLNSYIGITGDNYAPGSIGVTSSGAVINTVRNTPGAIGYVDEPSLSNLPSAVDSPIIGPTYVLLRSEYASAETAQKVRDFFNNVLSDDNKLRSLGYEPLADKTESINAINSIQP